MAGTMFIMKRGYAFELDGGEEFVHPDDERWEIVVYTPRGNEEHVGERDIDGARCAVFYCPDDEKFRAQLSHCCRD